MNKFTLECDIQIGDISNASSNEWQSKEIKIDKIIDIFRLKHSFDRINYHTFGVNSNGVIDCCAGRHNDKHDQLQNDPIPIVSFGSTRHNSDSLTKHKSDNSIERLYVT